MTPISTHHTDAIVQRFFDTFGRGDIPALLELLTDDIDWKVQGSPEVPWTGQRRGRAQVEQFFSALATSAEVQDFQIHSRLIQDQHAVVLGFFKWRVKQTQRTFEGDWAIHLVVRDTTIAQYQMFENSYAVAQAFRAS
jgi:ketosteroid isomerase-like protein